MKAAVFPNFQKNNALECARGVSFTLMVTVLSA